jgi:uncharacterized protein (TIGR03118 family)
MTTLRRLICLGCVSLLVGLPASTQAGGWYFQQTNLVSDVPGMALNTDANLKNPWGISSSATSPFWVSNQVTGTSTLYNGVGKPQALIVTIPPSGGGGNPTGQIFNTSSDFALTTGGKALFIFASLNGTISGWNGAQGTTAQIAATTAGAAYTGLAFGNNGSGNFLYAANAAGNRIDVFNGSFSPTTLTGSFVDSTLPAGFTVYNVQHLGGSIFVTYENETSGGGVVNEFDLNGTFLRRISANGAGGPLESPWGLALAPSGFGLFGGALLVGNEDDGHISAFDPTTGNFLGQLLDKDGNPIANTGLWGLIVGNGGSGGDKDKLYFAAGINGEVNGLFGSLTAVPEPSSNALGMIAITSVVAGSRWRARRAARAA